MQTNSPLSCINLSFFSTVIFFILLIYTFVPLMLITIADAIAYAGVYVCACANTIWYNSVCFIRYLQIIPIVIFIYSFIQIKLKHLLFFILSYFSPKKSRRRRNRRRRRRRQDDKRKNMLISLYQILQDGNIWYCQYITYLFTTFRKFYSTCAYLYLFYFIHFLFLFLFCFVLVVCLVLITDTN